MSVIGSNIIAGASGTVETGYQIARSLRFNSADSAYLNRTPGSAGNRKTMTLSIWLKRTAFGTQTHIFSAGTSGASNCDWLEFQADNTLRLGSYNGAFNFQYVTSQVFRDPSAFLHINVAIDTTNATSTDRIKISINGSRVTAFSTSSAPSLNADCPFFNTAVAHYIGKLVDQSVFINAYKADIRFIDGQALDPTSFGETDSATGVWVPKAYTGTYGTNGFWLKFDDNSGTTSTTLGKDSSGNGNNWTPNNFSVTAGVGNDSLVDSPTNYGTDTGAGGEVRGNYCTWNAVAADKESYANGNLDLTGTSATNRIARGTIAVSSDKYYWEYTITNGSGSVFLVGVAALSATGSGGTPVGNSVFYAGSSGNKYVNGTSSAYGATFTTNDVIGVALDLSANTVTFYKNNVSQGSISLTADTYTPSSITNSTSQTLSANFGQRPFAYTAPSGFKALCTQNLPTPAIGASASTLASNNMNILTWSGDSVSGRQLTGLGFSPDFSWIKDRAVANGHRIFDKVRGAAIHLASHNTNAEVSNNIFGYLSAFGTDGFTLTQGSSGIDDVNKTGETYVGWCWKANGAGVSNTAGSITSTVSANQTAGISVVTYTGTGSNATVGHGLGVAPRMMIFKNRSSAIEWQVYHASIGNGQYGVLNSTAAFTASGIWQNTTPTSTVFSIGNFSGVNTNGNNYVAYCFAEIAGFSKFGSYTGNGSTDGPFVYCGFRPRFIFFKRTDSTGHWNIFDTARNTYNATDLALYPSLSNAETSQGTTGNLNDILSNGFKLRGTGVDANASGGTYIFAAFAEFPFQYARAR